MWFARSGRWIVHFKWTKRIAQGSRQHFLICGRGQYTFINYPNPKWGCPKSRRFQKRVYHHFPHKNNTFSGKLQILHCSASSVPNFWGLKPAGETLLTNEKAPVIFVGGMVPGPPPSPPLSNVSLNLPLPNLDLSDSCLLNLCPSNLSITSIKLTNLPLLTYTKPTSIRPMSIKLDI